MGADAFAEFVASRQPTPEEAAAAARLRLAPERLNTESRPHRKPVPAAFRAWQGLPRADARGMKAMSPDVLYSLLDQ